jgi:hypothetical protein
MMEQWTTEKDVVGKPLPWPLQTTGLSDDEHAALKRLVGTWHGKLIRNKMRQEYYDRKNRLKDLGISIPPLLKVVETVSGWPAKAVDALAARSRFDGFTFAEEVDTPLAGVLRDNDFKSTYKQALRTALTHSCSFITISAGGKGEPDVLLSAYSALSAAALWDVRKKRISYGLTIIDVDHETERPVWMNLYTEEAVIELVFNGSVWQANRTVHAHGRPLMEPLVYSPSLERPFGRSRINRAVMSLADSAVRQALRSEVAAEFFTAPQRYLLGADEKDFDRDRWSTYIGNIFTAGRDENDNVPTYGQLPQGSMQPHIDYMRSLAAQFAGETNIPVSYLGIIHDNPASAQAMNAAAEELIIEAGDLNDDNTRSLRSIGLLVMAIATNRPLSGLTDAERSIMPKFMNPSRPSIVSQSDAIVKQVTAIPGLGSSQVALEELGYSEEQIVRIQADMLKGQALEALAKSGVGMPGMISENAANGD